MKNFSKNGNYLGEILNWLKVTKNYRDKKIIYRLEQSGCIISRDPRRDERGEKYYYRTEKGTNLLQNIPG